MATPNLTLTQVADRLATMGYVISMEGTDLPREDLIAFANSLEESIAALLAQANEESV